MANGKRVQITVPEEIADEWEKISFQVGVSLSSWIIMQVNRPDSSETLVQILGKLESMERSSSATHEVIAESLPQVVSGVISLNERAYAMHQFAKTAWPELSRWSGVVSDRLDVISNRSRAIAEWVNTFDSKLEAFRRRIRRQD